MWWILKLHPPRHRIFMFALCIISGLEKAIFLCCKHVYDSMWSSVAECLCWSNKYSLRVYRNDMLKCDNMRTRLTQIVQFFPLSHQHSIDNGAELSAREKFPFRWNLNWIPSRKNTLWVNMSLTDYESSFSASAISAATSVVWIVTREKSISCITKTPKFYSDMRLNWFWLNFSSVFLQSSVLRFLRDGTEFGTHRAPDQRG